MGQNDILNVLTEKSVRWVHGEMCKSINVLNVQKDKCIDGKLCQKKLNQFAICQN